MAIKASNRDSVANARQHPPAERLFGAHVSVAGGLEKAFENGAAVGCHCIQIFVKNQRQWRAPELTDDQIARFRTAHEESNIRPVVAHASYLLNLASPERRKREASINALIDELNRCEALGVSAIVFHPGAFMDSSHKEGIRRIASSLDTVHRRTREFTTKVLLETTAGQGSSIGWQLEQIGDILDRVRERSPLGVCLDTCHLFAAGYDFRDKSGYDGLIEEVSRTVGLQNVRCIHVNDSKREAGSRVDRHEHIGKGKIGKRGLAHFVNDDRFLRVPMILETPKGVDGRGTDLDKVNLKRLRSLIA